MKRHLYGGLTLAAAALLCLAGCKKENEGEKVVLGTQFEKSVSAQKTYLGEGNTVCWSEGDEVTVNTETVTVSNGSVNVTKAKSYYAVYPAEGNSVNATGGTVTVPASQTYTLENGKQVLNGPMAARLDASSGILYFKNLYSLLKVTVCADEKAFTVNSITVTGTGNLAGTYRFVFKGATTTEASTAPTVGEITSGSAKVTLNCSSDNTVTANSDKDFYLVVHPLTTAQNLTVKVYGVLDGKSVVYTHTTATTISLSRSRIGGLAVNLQQLKPGLYVDLGLSVLWATCNVGAENPWDYGDYFAWGETEPYYTSLTWSGLNSPTVNGWKTGKNTGYDWESYPFHNGTSEIGDKPYDASTGVLLPEHDAAHVNWGGSWRMPTEEEMKELVDKCDWEWVTNYENTGVKGYKIYLPNDHTDFIFLPATGYFSETSFQEVYLPMPELEKLFGIYWTSSIDPADHTNACYLYALHEAHGTRIDYPEYNLNDAYATYMRTRGFPIRPVMSK